jgi:hypothetical protein
MRGIGRQGFWWGLVLAICLAGPLAAQQFEAEKVTTPGQIAIATRGVFTIHDPDPEALDERAALVQARLNFLLSTRESPQIRVGGRPGAYVVLVDNQQLVSVTPADARFHNTSAKALAESWAANLRRTIQDSALLQKHLSTNVRPAYVYYGGQTYTRSERSLPTVAGLKSTGYAQFRKLLFVDASPAPPEQIYLRDADGNYVIYERYRAPGELRKEQGESVPL